MNKPSKRVWKIIRGDSIPKKDQKSFFNSHFFTELNKTQWNRNSLPLGSEVAEPDFEKIWEKIELESKNNIASNPRKITMEILKYAAVILLGLIAFYAGSKTGNNTSVNPSEAYVFMTPRGVRSEIRLPDNSRVWLNSDSRLNYDKEFGINNRNLVFEGEAIFKVIKNDELPFTITTDNSKSIRAVGTEFFVSAYEESDNFITSLIEGSILVNSGSEKLIVDNPETIVFNSGDGRIIERSELREYQLAWKDGKLIFENTPLFEIVTRLSNWYNIPISVSESIENQRFTLTLENEEPEEVINLLKLASDIDYEKNENGFTIIPKKN